MTIRVENLADELNSENLTNTVRAHSTFEGNCIKGETGILIYKSYFRWSFHCPAGSQIRSIGKRPEYRLPRLE